jgi:hypothetical protein
MKQFLLLSLGIFVGIPLFSQESKMNLKVFDSTSNHDIMIGYCTLAGMTDTAFNSAYKAEYNVYKPDNETVEQIYTLLDGIKVIIVMGTWCSDSREQVPRFMKIFDFPGQAFPEPIIICVDRGKKAGDVSLEGMDILKVPTFIIYHYGMELGRIVETPNTSMEKDLLPILKKKL